MKTQSFVEYWSKHKCVFCDTVNWTYHSHSERHYTGLYLNTDACRCWKCKKTYWLAESQATQPTIQDGNPRSEIVRDT